MKIGVTERGDPSLDFSWVKKMDSVDAAILITKNLSDKVLSAAEPFFDKLKFHVTCTGYGGTKVEPNIPGPDSQLRQTLKLVNSGFPHDRIVIRVDPIIPTERGLQRARGVIACFAEAGFHVYRVSLIDMYPHVRQRFKDNKLPRPYLESFEPFALHFSHVDEMLKEVKTEHPGIRIESCAEPQLKEAERVGCVSECDAAQFGLQIPARTRNRQRKDCLCCSAKTELLSDKKQCAYGCLYCYWK